MLKRPATVLHAAALKLATEESLIAFRQALQFCYAPIGTFPGTRH